MPLLQWNPRFSVQVQQMDDDHRKLFEVLNDLWQVTERTSGPSAVGEALQRVITEMTDHFSREEAYLEQRGYPKLRQQRQEHGQLLSRLDQLAANVARGDTQSLDLDALDFVGDWLCNHILKSDFDYAGFAAQASSKAVARAEIARVPGNFYERLPLSKKVGALLAMIVVVVNLVMAGLLTYTLNRAMAQQEKEVRTTVENTAQMLDRNISESVSKIDLSLREIVDHLERDLRSRGRLDPEEMKTLLEQRRSWLMGLADFRVTNASGVVEYGAGVDPAETTSLADRGHFIMHRDNRDSGMVVTNPLLGRFSRTWLVSFSRRYQEPDGAFAGIITATVPVTYFSDLLSSIALGPKGIALLRDSATGLVARYPLNPSQEVGSKTFSQELADAIASGERARTFHARKTGDGVERIDAYRRLTSVPFHLVVGASVEDSFEQLDAESQKAIFGGILFFFLSTATGWLIWRSIDLAEKANSSAQFAREIARTKQQLSEAIRIARLGFIEINPATGTLSLGEGTHEMLGVDPALSEGLVSEVLNKVVPEDLAGLRDLLAVTDQACFELDLHVEDRVLHALGEPVDTSGSSANILITLQDITQRHSAEVERAKMIERISEASRLESLGTLAGGVAHEINTPAQYIGDNLSFIKEWLPRLLEVVKAGREATASGDWTDVAEKVAAIRYDFALRELTGAADQALEGVGRISAIVRAIKEFSYPSGKTPHPFDLNRAVENAVTVTRSQWKYVAELDLDLAPALPPLNAIEGEINQVLVNLIVNAAQAISEAGRDEPGKITVATIASGDWVEVSVADSGIGIPKENLDRLFELFFTTKPPGQGTGQGLAITQAIIHRHGGTVTVESEPGRGACFRIRLPVAGEA